MIICSNCQHVEVSGALFCSECGAKLAKKDHSITQDIRAELEKRENASISGWNDSLELVSGYDDKERQIIIRILPHGERIELIGQIEYSIGRSAEGQPILPDVDLTAFEAYLQGVSRLHAILRVVRGEIFICDLGSSNGTRINGARIEANIEVPVKHGDIIGLGKLNVQILMPG
jgi:pSer/pThr/pTyr-binding forkhead associated (FHA) protein